MPEQIPCCTHCDSTQVIRHGFSRYGKQRYKCHSCGRCCTSESGSNAYDEATKERILRAYQERTSLRGLTRIFGVSRNTVNSWLKKTPPTATPGTDPLAGSAPVPSRGAGIG